MTLRIAEWFGHDVNDWSIQALADRTSETCPFLALPCTKTFNDGTRSGVCSVTATAAGQVIVCPNRMYASNYQILQDVADTAFGTGTRIVHPQMFRQVSHDGTYVIAFGKRFGSELRLPNTAGTGGYFVDWILARISSGSDLAEFVAVEIQTIDTTGTYRPEVVDLRQGDQVVRPSRAGLNWENVNKRILPQVIYKGHVLRLEPKCTKGLFFVCPTAVYRRIRDRLGGGGALREYANLQPGSITFLRYGFGGPVASSIALTNEGRFSTTIDQVALAFTGAGNLPVSGVYEQAIQAALGRL